MKNSQFFIFVGLYLFSNLLFSQECDSDYTYFQDIPVNVSNISNENNCFYNDDISVINNLREINNLNYTSPLEVGPQIWILS